MADGEEASTVPAVSIYTSELTGSDETGKGTADAPYKTVVHAIITHGENIAVFVDPEDAAAASDEVRSDINIVLSACVRFDILMPSQYRSTGQLPRAASRS